MQMLKTQLISLIIGFALIQLYCTDSSQTNPDQCGPGEVWIEGQGCVPLNSDVGGDAGLDAGDAGTDGGSPYTRCTPDPSTCNYTDNPDCWVCCEDSYGIHCLQKNPDYPTTDYSDWTCQDKQAQRICEATGDRTGTTSTDWDCFYADGITVCTAIDPDLPDDEHDPWDCYYLDGERYCDFNFCHYGNILGSICDTSSGISLNGATVSIDTPNCNADGQATIEAVTESYGLFEMLNVPTGTYMVNLNGEPTGKAVIVEEGENAIYNDNRCLRSHCQFGSLEGQVCNNEALHWVFDGVVSLTIPANPGCGLPEEYTLTQPTDEDGYVSIQDIPVGSYSVTITEAGYTRTETISIAANETTPLPGNLTCDCENGSLSGQGCFNHEWMAGGRVVVNVPAGCGYPEAHQLEGLISEDEEALGSFRIDHLPVGTHSVQVYDALGLPIGEPQSIVIDAGEVASFSGPGTCACDDCSRSEEITFVANRFDCHHIWVANGKNGSIWDPPNGKVYRVDVDNTAEVKTYSTYGDDASRTSVDNNCNVWVANRGNVGTNPDKYNFVMLKQNCTPDASGDGCALCKIRIGNNASKFRGIAVDKDNNIWVGESVTRNVYQVTVTANGCGAPQLKFASPDVGANYTQDGVLQSFHNYGFAIRNNILWVNHLATGITRYDMSNGSLFSVKRADHPRLCPYSIAVDEDGNAWAANTQMITPNECAGYGLCKISWNGLSLNSPECFATDYYNNNGIVVDKKLGIVWVVGSADNPNEHVDNHIFGYDILGGGMAPDSYLTTYGGRGVALDYHDNIWTVTKSGNVHQLIYDSAHGYNSSRLTVNVGPTTYTYSDFSGYGLFTYAMNTTQIMTFDAGPGGTTYAWNRMQWSGLSAIPGMQVRFKFRSIPTLEGIGPDSGWSGPVDVYTADGAINDLLPYLFAEERYFQVQIFAQYEGAIEGLTLDITVFWDKTI